MRYEYVTTPFGFFSNAKSDLNNLGPAVGVAWNPKGFRGGRFVLRGGYRISYDQVFQNVLLNVSRNFPRAVTFATTLTGAQPYNVLPPTPQPQDFKGDPNMLPLRLYSPNKRIDQPHRFVASYTYEMPKLQVGSGIIKPFVDRAINGWGLAGVTTLASGTPYSILNANNALGVLSGQIQPIEFSQRVTLNPNGAFPQFSVFDAQGQLTNPNARFIAFPAYSGVLGSLGANTQRTGGTNNTNMAVIKNVKTYGENQSLQIRWEVTNIFNHRNFTVIPLNTVGSSTNAFQFLNLGQTNVTGRSMLFTARYFF